MSDYSIHPAADLFPMMKADELDALADDIKANGQQQPIAVHRDLVLDGRNRLEACRRAGVPPIYQDMKREDTLKQNRTEGQNCPSDQGPAISIEQSAELMNVSARSVKSAKKTMRDDPEAHEAAKRGEKPEKPMTSRAAGDYWVRVASSCYEQETGQKRSDKWVRNSIRPMLEERLPWFKEKDKRSLLNESQAEEVRKVVCEFADSARDAVAEPLQAQAEETAAVLSKTAQEKLETAIRVHKRLADREFDERVRAEVTRRLDEDVLPTYAEEYERYKAFNDAWRGVFSHQEYKTLKGFLHPDRHPNEPDKAARLFRLVNEKEEILCGIKQSVARERPATLPKTVGRMRIASCRRRGPVSRGRGRRRARRTCARSWTR